MRLKQVLGTIGGMLALGVVGVIALLYFKPPLGTIAEIDVGHLRYEGGIGTQEPFVLASLLLGRESPVILELNSDGGHVFGALLMWALLAPLDIETRVLSGDACRSACTVVFSAGDARRAAPDAIIGFHDIREDCGRDEEAGGLLKDFMKGLYLGALRTADRKTIYALEHDGVFDTITMTDIHGADIHPGFVTGLLPPGGTDPGPTGM